MQSCLSFENGVYFGDSYSTDSNTDFRAVTYSLHVGSLVKSIVNKDQIWVCPVFWN